ncbi:type II methionyl aminopeptidase [archaeon]|nr:type II methionyl aminopeptidase [archaeon]
MEDTEEMLKLLKAGKIAAEVLLYAKSLAKPGINLLDMAEQIEARIVQLGAKPAFPVNLSINSQAAHFTPQDSSLFLSENYLLKIDIGVEVDGFIGDTAATLGSNKELIKASQDALNQAIRLCTPSTPVNEIGKRIGEVISGYGFSPIINLSGHELKQGILHAGLTIPNHNNNDKTMLKEGQVIAIEPFATNGAGKVIDGKPSSIFRFIQEKPIRNQDARNLMNYIKTEHPSLPFAKRWIAKKFQAAGFLLAILEREGIINQYNVLVESSKGLVSQAEHTIIVKDKPIITTNPD